MDNDLTKEEQNAINTLRRLEKRWPDSLWLFSASGSLCVMKKNSDGERMSRGESFDPNGHVVTIGIENDGGDW